MKKILKEFLDALIPVSIGSTMVLLGIFFMKNTIDSQSMQENGTKTVDTVYVHVIKMIDTVYVHDTIFMQHQ